MGGEGFEGRKPKMESFQAGGSQARKRRLSETAKRRDPTGRPAGETLSRTLGIK